MNGHIIDLYKQKKIKILISYAQILEDIITLPENTLWSNNREFQEINSKVTTLFADKYYFDNNLNRNDPIEYFNDNINAVLLSIIEYYQNNNQKDIINTKKNETFLLSVIVCSASYIDIASNSLDGNYLKMQNNFKKLLKYLNQTNLLKVYYNNKIILKKLFALVKNNLKEEKKFFNYYKSTKYYNEYKLICENPLLYRVQFIYKMNLEEKEKTIINKYQHQYLKEYLTISYELLAIKLMQEYIMNKIVNTYVVPVVDGADLSVLKHPLIMDNIRLLVPLEQLKSFKNPDGFKVIYYHNGEDLTKIDEEITILTKEDIISSNLKVKVIKEYFKDKEEEK